MLPRTLGSLCTQYLKPNPTGLVLWSWAGRWISTELTTALRPFYFAVHPDLFAQHPKQRIVNENSLKQLSSHMQSLYEQKFNVINEAKTLRFYIRDGNSTARDSFKLIQINLDSRVKEPKILIKKLLELCNLPTDQITSIKSTVNLDLKSSIRTAKKTKSEFREKDSGRDINYGSDFIKFELKYHARKKHVQNSLKKWITDNANLAKKRSDQLIGVKKEVAKLQEAVISRLELSDVRYDCGWNLEHYRGCLKTLERLANMHQRHMAILKGRVVVFAAFTGVSLEGHVMLFTGDVLNNWLDFIRNIPHEDEFLRKIPHYEDTLSQVLLRIRIGRRKFMPKQQAKEYVRYLNKVTTSLGDYLTANKYPEAWPETLSDYEIVVESEAGPLMVGPTGQFITPATCPGWMLIDFISDNMESAKTLAQKYQSHKYVEKQLVDQCIGQLQLKTLTKDDSVTPEKMINTVTELLKMNVKEFENLDLHITNYYSVLNDGLVCIPWDFTCK